MAVSYSPVAEVAQAGPTVSVESPRRSELKLVSAKKSLSDGKVDELRDASLKTRGRNKLPAFISRCRYGERLSNLCTARGPNRRLRKR